MTPAQRLIAARDPHLAASYRTLDKHASIGAFNRTAALKLLRNNARAIRPRLTPHARHIAAIELLDHWTNHR